MKLFRLLVMAILPLLSSVLTTPDWALAQVRPGVRAFVTAPEGCSIIDPVQTEDPYSFINAQIRSLFFAKEGERVNRDVLAAAYGPPMDRMGKAFSGLRQERIDNSCASFLVAPFAASKNEKTAAAAKVLTEGYDELSKMTDEMLRLNMVETMHRKTGGSTYVEFSQMIKRRQEIVEKMTDALIESLVDLIDPRRMDVDGKPNRLILTRDQIDALLENLQSAFPNLKLEQSSSRSGDFAKQAALIQSFLSGDYKPADN